MHPSLVVKDEEGLYNQATCRPAMWAEVINDIII